jgi:nucleoside-diphosphate-sugar epimerase
MKNRSISVTGATGFLGWHLCDAFQTAGWQVRAIVRPGNRKPLPAGVDQVPAALSPPSLRQAIDGSDVVVHCAAVIRAPDEMTFNAVNVEGTRALVDASNSVGARFVHLSSQAAIGTGTPERPSREEDPPHPVNAYGRSKLASEMVVRSACRTPWTIVRPCAVYGPRDRGFLPLFRLARRGLFVLPSPPATAFTLIYVDDLVRAIVQAASDDRAVGQTMFVGHPEPQPTEDVLRALAHSYGRTYRPLRVPPTVLGALASLGQAAWRLGHRPLLDSGRLKELQAVGFVCAVDRVRDVLGFTAAVSLRDGIQRTRQWYSERHWV